MAGKSNQRNAKRTRGRELALQYLYQWDLLKWRQSQPSESPSAFVGQMAANVEETGATGENKEDVRLARTTDNVVNEYAIRLIEGVIQRQAEIDAAILATTHNWSLSRMATVDRTILRIATFELGFCPDVPPRVSINEAIELAKKYSTEKSSAFVNGILDRIPHMFGRSAKPATAAEAASSGR